MLFSLLTRRGGQTLRATPDYLRGGRRDGSCTPARSSILRAVTSLGRRRSDAEGWSIGVFQFVKSAKWRIGEQSALEALGELSTERGRGSVEWHKMGSGVVLESQGRQRR